MYTLPVYLANPMAVMTRLLSVAELAVWGLQGSVTLLCVWYCRHKICPAHGC